MLTASNLFAGDLHPAGPNRCVMCGSACGDEFTAELVIKDTFTARPSLPNPASPHACRGCVEATACGVDVVMHGGEVRPGQKRFTYSWVLTAGGRVAATKAHRAWLEEVCLHPPAPPYAIVLADSGQKHLVYQARVGFDAGVAVANLEGLVVEYRPAALAERLDLCRRLAAATGKPALAERPGVGLGIALRKHFGRGGLELLRKWDAVWTAPLSRLAAWLCPPKEECLALFPAGSEGAAGVGPAAVEATPCPPAPAIFAAAATKVSPTPPARSKPAPPPARMLF